nr:unnamed protein product [Spirometra erinaceieuropaei]
MSVKKNEEDAGRCSSCTSWNIGVEEMDSSQMIAIFEECQETSLSHDRLCSTLMNLYQQMPFSHFTEEFFELCRYSLVSAERSPFRERTVDFIVRFVMQASKHSNSTCDETSTKNQLLIKTFLFCAKVITLLSHLKSVDQKVSFRAPICLIGHLRTNCSSQTTPTNVSPSAPCVTPTPTINNDCTPKSPLPSSIALTSAAAAPAPTTTAHNPDAPSNISLSTVNTSDVDSAQICRHCDHTFTSHIGLVDHFRIHRIKTDEPVSGAPTYTRPIRHHCPRTLNAWAFLVTNVSGIHRSIDTPSTP